jgi:hypothetical protein
MSAYVKGLIFSLLLFFLFIPSYGLVIGAVVVVSAVKIIAALLSFLAIPVAGVAHFFVKGKLIWKISFVMGVLFVVGVLAYFLLTTNFIVEEEFSFKGIQEQSIGFKGAQDVKGLDSALIIDLVPEQYDPTKEFVKIFVTFSSVITAVLFVLSSTISILVKKLANKELNTKEHLLKMFFISMFFGGLIGLVSTIKIYPLLW